MATHSSVLTWRIPGTVEPGGLPSMRSHRVRHHWRDLAAVSWASYPFTFLLTAQYLILWKNHNLFHHPYCLDCFEDLISNKSCTMPSEVESSRNGQKFHLKHKIVIQDWHQGSEEGRSRNGWGRSWTLTQADSLNRPHLYRKGSSELSWIGWKWLDFLWLQVPGATFSGHGLRWGCALQPRWTSKERFG